MYFAVSKECNLNCSYCYLGEHKQTPAEIDITAKNAADRFYVKSTNEKQIIGNVTLHGAEPTILSPEALAYVVNTFHKLTGNVVRVQTNGTLLTKTYVDKVIGELGVDYLAKLRFGISMDGHKELHNTNRCNSFDTILKNIPYLKELGLLGPFLIVITNDTTKAIHRFTAFLDTLDSANLQYKFKLAEHGYELTSTNMQVFIDMVATTGRQHCLQANTENICINSGNSCEFFEFDIDGKVYTCNKTYVPGKDFANWHSDSFKSIRNSRTKVFRDEVISDECLTCEMYDKCHGGCPATRIEGKATDCKVRQELKAGIVPKKLYNKLVPLSKKLNQLGVRGKVISGIVPLFEDEDCSGCGCSACGGGPSSSPSPSSSGSPGSSSNSGKQTTLNINSGGLQSSIDSLNRIGGTGTGPKANNSVSSIAENASSMNGWKGASRGAATSLSGTWGNDTMVGGVSAQGFGFGVSSTESFFGAHVSTNYVGYAPSISKIGGPVGGVSYNASSIFGISYNTDTRYTSDGRELSVAGEAVADSSDMFGWGLSNDVAQAIGSVIGIGAGHVVGATAVTTFIGVANATVDIAYAAGKMSPEEVSTAKAGILAVSVVNTLYEVTTTLHAVANVPSEYMTTAEKVIIGGLAGAKGYVQVGGFGGMTGSVTGNVADTFSGFSSSSSAGSFGAYTAGKNYSSYNQVWDAYSQWQYETGGGFDTSLDTVQKDPFDYLAGGKLYDVQSAGNDLYVAQSMRSPYKINNRKLGLSKSDRISVLQEEGRYFNLQPIDTNPAEDSTIGYRAGQISQLNRLVAEYSQTIEDYNEAVATYNDTFVGVSYNTQEAYDEALASSETMKASLDASAADIATLGTNITDLREQFNL